MFLPRDSCPTLHCGFHGAKARRVVDELGLATNDVRRRGTAYNIKRDNGAETLEHPLRGRMRGMARQPWVADAAHSRMGRKPFGKDGSRCLRSLESNGECSGTSHGEKCFERA